MKKKGGDTMKRIGIEEIVRFVLDVHKEIESMEVEELQILIALTNKLGSHASCKIIELYAGGQNV